MKRHINYSKEDIKFRKELDDKLNNHLKKNQYRVNSNPVGVIFSILLLGLFYSLFFYINLVGLTYAQIFLSLFVMAVCQIILLVNHGHEYGHGAMCSSRKCNTFMYKLIFDGSGIDSYLWRYTHNLIHHPFPNINQYDFDINGNKFLRMGPHEKHLSHHKYQFIYAPFLYSLFFLNKFFIKDFKTIEKVKVLYEVSESEYHKEYMKMIIKKISYLFFFIMMPSLFGIYSILNILIVFVSYHLATSIILGFLLGGSHSNTLVKIKEATKDGNIKESFSRHQIQAALDLNGTSTFWTFIMGGTSSHIAHHIYPNISAKHYVFIAKEIQKLSAKYNIEYHNTNLLNYFYEHWKYLRRLSENNKPLGEQYEVNI